MTTKEEIKEAAQALAELNVLYAVIGALENGTIGGCKKSANSSALRVIAICKKEASRQLDRHDRAMRRILKSCGETQ